MTPAPTPEQAAAAFEWLRAVALAPEAPIEASHALIAWQLAVMALLLERQVVTVH
jgi:hypothetical protein